MRRFVVVLGLLVFAVFPSAAQTKQALPSTGDFAGCPPEGRAKSAKGFFDPALNRRKNRDVPPSTYVVRDLPAVITNPPVVVAMGKHARSAWTQEARDAVSDWEATGASVEGRLIAIRTQGPESCNCGSATDVDTHMWIATQASASAKPSSLVVEISPRTQALYHWDHATLVKLAKQGAQVRISGWMLWDEEHGSEVGKSRGTLWEVHPIHKIEAFQNNNWVDLGKQ